MSHDTPDDAFEHAHVLLDTNTFENALEMLLSPGERLDFSPFPDVAHDLQFPNSLPVTSGGVGSADHGIDSDGGFDGSKVEGDELERTAGGGHVVPAGRKRRVNTNQAEVQKRYRERKKNKLDDLERTVDALRAQILEMQKSHGNSTSVLATSTDSDSHGPFGDGGGSKQPSKQPSKSLRDDPENFPDPPDSGTNSTQDLDLWDPHAHYVVGDDKGESRLKDIIATTVAAKDESIAQRTHKKFWFALEVADALKRGGAVNSDKKKKTPSATGKFKSFADAELFFAGVTKLYDVGVEKLKGLLFIGASDADVRDAVNDVVGVVADARRHRPDVSFFTTQMATIQMLDDDCDPAACGRGGFSSICPTSCAYLVKSVVDRTLMKGDWDDICESVIETLPPSEVNKIIQWSDEFLGARKAVLMQRARVLFLRPLPNTKTVNGMTVASDSLYRVPKKELVDGLHGLHGGGGESSESETTAATVMFEGLQEEMRLHHCGTCKLFETLSPRSAAAIIILTHPVALDTFSLATELKKKKGIDPKNQTWRWLEEATAAKNAA